MRTKILRILPVFSCAVIPAVVVSLLVQYYFHRSLIHYTPIWSDEIGYWREIYTFKHVGFGGGYYTIDELPAEATFTRFGAHGPSVAILLGLVAYVVGWGYTFGPVFNLAFFAIAITFYLLIVKADRWQFVVGMISLMSFWPVILYIPTTMVESLYQSLAIILGGMFYLLIRYPSRCTRIYYTAMVALLVIASILRPTWAPLVFCFLLFRFREISFRRFLSSALISVLFVFAAFSVNRWISSPFPYFINEAAEKGRSSIWEGVGMVLEHCWANINMLFDGVAVDLGLRLQLLFIFFFSVGFLGYKLYQKLRAVCGFISKSQKYCNDVTKLSIFHVVNLGTILLFVLAANDIADWRGYRLFSPHVLLSIFVVLPFARRRLILAIRSRIYFARVVLLRYSFFAVPVVINLSLIISFGSVFESFHGKHFSPEARRPTVLSTAVKYQPLGDPWQNTLLIDECNYNSELLKLPPGIGISLIMDFEALQKPIKSKYILVTDTSFPFIKSRVEDPQALRFLGGTPYGKLYERID